MQHSIRYFSRWLIVLPFLFFTHNSQAKSISPEHSPPLEKIIKTKEEWKKILTPEQYHIAREKGTEPAYSGKYLSHYSKGHYVCSSCGHPLFSSKTKYNSETGWPSFWEPISPFAVSTAIDNTWFTTRTELLCKRCGAHIGHLFNDGPPPTGKRYCINSISLTFVPDK